jgi:3-dehydroquinate synthase
MLHNIIIDTNYNTFETWINQQNYTEIAVLVDENTNQFCYPLLQKKLPKHQIIIIKSGEKHKNLKTCQQVWKQLTHLNFSRKALLINIGGGVIGDLGGFCAATYKRGIDFIQIPTTLLAQVDASVGGKTGIDFQNFKNQIGVFNIPKLTWINTNFLATLPERELKSGFAEVIKHTLIADKNAWKDLIKKEKWQDHDWQKIVEHSVNIKKNIVEKDFDEKNIRKILNFGHTLGHAIESFYLNKPSKKLLHGEAIAQGMIWASQLSQKIGFSVIETQEIDEYITNIYGELKLKKNEIENIIQLIYQDKKNFNHQINFVLLESIGKPIFDVKIEENEIKNIFYI